MPPRRTQTTRTRQRTLKAQIGRFDGELKTIPFRQGESVNVLLEKAGLSYSKGDEINDEEGNTISPNDNAVNGMTYYVTSNYRNGK